MSDLISKQEVIKSIDRFIPTDPMMSDYTQGISVGLAIATRCIEGFSQENHDSSQGLVKDLIRRQDAIDIIQMNRDEEAKKSLSADAKHKSVIRSKHDAHVAFCDYLIEAVKELPSAEKTQLSGEDATSVCKCPCVYREPCDYCHYDGHLGLGCPAEEGLRDE